MRVTFIRYASQRVGSGSDAFNRGAKPVAFGKAKREAVKVESLQRVEAAERFQTRRDKSPAEVEEAAWVRVTRDYGFMLKPAYHSWRTFLDELERYEMRWTSLSIEQVRCRFEMFDHNPVRPDKGSVSAKLAELTFSERMATGNALAAIQEAVRLMHVSSQPTHNVGFMDQESGTDTTVEFETYLHAECPVQVPASQTWAGRKVSEKDDPVMKRVRDGPAASSGQSGDALSVKPLDQGPWVCVRGRLNDLRGTASPELFDMSLPALTSVVLRSWAVYLNSEFMPGSKVYEQIAAVHVEKDLAPMWNFLRAAAKMHPSALPVDPQLLTRHSP